MDGAFYLFVPDLEVRLHEMLDEQVPS